VEPGNTTDASGVPLLITDVGKAFSHWSATPNGTAFDFGTPITQNIKLYVVLADLWTVTFNTQGGTNQDNLPMVPIYIVNGEQLGSHIPIRPGYSFVEWNTAANGTGTRYTSNSVITSSLTLYAQWTPNTQTPYTVVYWQENANDDEFSYVETATRTGTTDTPATYQSKNYTGFELNTAMTDAAAVNIAGNGSTVRYVYYNRKTYTLNFYRDSWTNTLLRSFPNMKYGEDTSTEWYEVSGDYPQYLWATSDGGSTYYSAPPAMPNRNLSVYGQDLGNTPYEIYYYKTGTTTSIKPKFTFEANSGMNITEAEDAIAIPGFTYSGNYSNFNNQTPRKAYIYYNVNKYIITFNSNDGSTPVSTSPIPYQDDISDKALSGYVKDVTVRSDGYIFKGWYTTAETLDGSEFLFSSQSMPSNNIILYAKWSPPQTISITHKILEPPLPDGNTVEEIDIPYGEPLDVSLLNDVVIVPDGYTIEDDLLGWYWYVGDAFVAFDLDMPIYSNIEVFPVWKIATYTISYDLNGGSGPVPEDNNLYYGGSTAFVLAPNGVTAPNDKVFIGWTYDGTIYYPNEDLTIEGNVTLKAQWGDVPVKTNLTYYANNGTTGSYIINDLNNNETHEVLSNADSNLEFTNGGYIFAGWNTKADASGIWINTGNSIIVGKEETTTPNQLYAQWAKISLTKEGVFNDENGNGKAEEGETIDYTFTVENEGEFPLNDVFIADSKVTPPQHLQGFIPLLLPT
jgi:uncharacterized repeat protein (TIGR02543 family)